MSTDQQLPPTWRFVEDAEERAQLEQQLGRELSPQHVLYRRQARLIARDEASDDVLFELDGGEVAVVHLTWSVGRDPRFPWSEVHTSVRGWLNSLQP